MSNLIVRLNNANIYQQQHAVLRGVTMTISQGEFAYLIGKTGSGKSSLLKVLYGALPLREGKGEVAGFDLLQLDRKKTPFLRRKLGVVFQDFNLLSDRNVDQNLRFVLSATGWKNEQDIRRRIEEVLAKVSLSDKLYSMPHELSGGEQQRVVIARALLNQPELIIADEPTGNLDSAMGNEIMEILENLNRADRTTIVMVTHDENMARRTHRLVRLFDGSLVSSNTFVN